MVVVVVVVVESSGQREEIISSQLSVIMDTRRCIRRHAYSSIRSFVRSFVNHLLPRNDCTTPVILETPSITNIC